MKVFRGTILKEELEFLTKSELNFLIQACSILNEINILHKITLFSNKDVKTDAGRRAQNSQSLFLFIILTGKLWEGWELVEKAYFGTKLSKTYHNLLPQEGIDRLSDLKSYFSKSDNLVKKVRNKIAFHYDSSEMLDQFRKAPKNEIFEIYLSESQGNCFYFLPSVLLLNAILEWTGISDSMKATDAFFSDVLTIARWFIDFLNLCVVTIAKKNVQWKWEEIDIPDPVGIDEVVLPYFVAESPNKSYDPSSKEKRQ